MSHTVYDSDLGVPRTRILQSGNTEDGGLRPAQDVFARYLKDRRIENPFIIDIGIGDGAVTVRKDLVEALMSAGIHQAFILGLDADRGRVHTARKCHENTLQCGRIPPGFQIHFHLADITALEHDNYNLKNVVTRLHSRGIAPAEQADLVVSSNLVPCMRPDLARISKHAMTSVTRPDGIMALGAGGAEHNTLATSLHYELYRPFQESTPLGSMPFDKDPYFHKQRAHVQEQLKAKFLQEVHRVAALQSEADIATDRFLDVSGPQEFRRT